MTSLFGKASKINDWAVQLSIMMEDENKNSNSSRFTSLNDFVKNTYGSTVSSSPLSNQTDALSLINNTNGEDDPSAFSGTSRATDDNSADNNIQKWTLRRIALDLSLWANIFITLTKLVAYIQTLSLSVLAALLDSILDVISQFGQYHKFHLSFSLMFLQVIWLFDFLLLFSPFSNNFSFKLYWKAFQHAEIICSIPSRRWVRKGIW